MPKFMLFKFVILFQSFSHFNVMLSIIYMLLLPRHSTPIMQCRCYFTPHHFHSKLSTKSLRLYNFPSPFCYSHPTCFPPHHFLISTPFVPTVVKIVFPSTFSPLCPSNHTNQNAASITQIATYSEPNIITSTFTENAIQFPTSTPLRLASTPPSLIDFRPQFLISTLII